MHGYQIMQELAERTGGRWRPSAGSIYPTLQQLEDEGLITSTEVDGRRVYDLTDAGRAAVADMPAERAWPGRADDGRDLRGLGREVGIAAMQVERMGSAAAVEAAAAILAGARRELYRLLADDPGDDPATSPQPTDATAADEG
jgi:DNA-binding PadR family transcriptional regulator